MEVSKSPEEFLKKEKQKEGKGWKLFSTLLVLVTLSYGAYTAYRVWDVWGGSLVLKETNTDSQTPVDNSSNPNINQSLFDGETKAEKITASSVLIDPSGKFDYSMENISDKDYTTAWVPKTNGIGGNEWIKIDFDKMKKVSGLEIFPGYAENQDLYFQNNRIKQMRIEFSQNPSELFELEDEFNFQILNFPEVSTEYIKIVIVDIYPGSKYDDIAITEIKIN